MWVFLPDELAQQTKLCLIDMQEKSQAKVLWMHSMKNDGDTAVQSLKGPFSLEVARKWTVIDGFLSDCNACCAVAQCIARAI